MGKASALPAGTTPVSLIGHDYVGAKPRLARFTIADIAALLGSGGGGGGTNPEILEAIAALETGKANRASLENEITGRIAGVATALAQALAAVAAEGNARAAADALRATYGELAAYLGGVAQAAMFTNAPAGHPATIAPAAQMVATDRGPAARIAGPGLIGMRGVVRLEPLRPVRVRWLYRRVADSDNPVNDPLQPVLVWLDADFDEIGRTPLDLVAALTAADGVQSASTVLNSALAEDVTTVWPEGAVFARPMLRSFGSATAATALYPFAVTPLLDGIGWTPSLEATLNTVGALIERVEGFGELIAAFGEILAQSRSAGYLQNGTLDDARLSSNVLLTDRAATVTGEQRHIGRLLVGGEGPSDGSLIIEMIGNKLAITPSAADGTPATTKQIVFDPAAEGKWVVEGGANFGGNTAITGWASFTDAATTRTNLDVYNKAYVDGILEAANAFQAKGGIDASTNPNYPAANAGHVYIVTVAGKVGGGAGIDVEAGDMLVCKTDNSAAGTQAAVGANWNIVQYNVVAPLKFADIGVTVQAHDADLAAIANLATTAFGRGLLTLADQAALLAAAGAQAADADLTAIANLATTAFGRGLLTLADQAALLAAAGAQAADSDLTAIAALTPANGDVLQRVGGVWVNRTLAQLAADLGSRRRLLSNAQQASHTGNTTLTVLRSVVLPGGALGPNGVLSYNVLWAMGLTVQNAAATVTGIRLGGVVIASPSLANTNRSHVRQGMLRNRNSQSSQVAAAAASANDPGSTSLVPSTFSIDTSVDQTLEIYVTLGNAADNAAVEAVTIEYSYGA